MDRKDKLIIDPRARPLTPKEGERIARFYKIVNYKPDGLVTCSGWPIGIFVAMLNKIDDHQHALSALQEKLKDEQLRGDKLEEKLNEIVSFLGM